MQYSNQYPTAYNYPGLNIAYSASSSPSSFQYKLIQSATTW